MNLSGGHFVLDKNMTRILSTSVVFILMLLKDNTEFYNEVSSSDPVMKIKKEQKWVNYCCHLTVIFDRHMAL